MTKGVEREGGKEGRSSTFSLHPQEEEFLAYAEYCLNYNSASDCLKQQARANNEMHTFLQQCQQSMEHYSLSDELFKPVQRIMKYHLLLKVSMCECMLAVKRYCSCNAKEVRVRLLVSRLIIHGKMATCDIISDKSGGFQNFH